VLDVEDWAEIRRLYQAEGLPIREVARVLGISRNTVRAALAAEGRTKYERRPAGSVVDAVEPRIRELLETDPRMPASLIAQRIGWAHGITVLRDRVALLRPAYLPFDPISRTVHAPGGIAQCDLWFPDVELPVGFGQTRTAKALPVLVMVCAHSGWLSALLIPSRTAGDLFAGWWRLIAGLEACPRTFVWEEENAIGHWRRGQAELTDQGEAFRDALGARVVVCRRVDLKATGLVERANGYLTTNFLPGRRFASPADFNYQLGEWLAAANGRTHRALGYRPADRIAADRAAMLPLPPVAPVTGSRSGQLLPADRYVNADGNRYSVPTGAAVGERVEIFCDLNRVQVFQAGRLVADHPRVWARHQVITVQTGVAAGRDHERN
jgi:transposase